MTHNPIIGAVAIGRNEGERLKRCLKSLVGQVRHLVYVDSGSTDESVSFAESLGIVVVHLDTTKPFTAARARNAGLAALLDLGPVEFVQFVDGDCEVVSGWIAKASVAMNGSADIAVVCGRRREIAPGASRYNAMIDAEWETPVGVALSCGGDAMMRVSSLLAVGGFRETLIAGEEPELCVRMRSNGGKILRIDAEMTRHDADMTHFSQWWQRTVRAGHAYAEGAALHGAPPERHFVAQTRRAVLWGGIGPAAILLGGLIWQPIWLLFLLWPLQVVRLALRSNGLMQASFLVLGKFAEFQGVATFYWRRWQKRDSTLIEYK